MTSIDVDTVNIHRFSIGGNYTLPSVHLTFDGFSHPWVNALLMILLVLIILDFGYHVIQSCKNSCKKSKVKPKARALLCTSDMHDGSETVI
tara:strand:+ start:205 stop:477 length:273 start_codon:yes stop_codon:yes gene_type:complete